MKGHLTRTINYSYLLYPFILLYLLLALQFPEQETPEHLFPVKWTHGQHPISNADRLTNTFPQPEGSRYNSGEPDGTYPSATKVPPLKEGM